MGDPKSNTDTVRAYYELGFNEGKPEEAVATYLATATSSTTHDEMRPRSSGYVRPNDREPERPEMA